MPRRSFSLLFCILILALVSTAPAAGQPAAATSTYYLPIVSKYTLYGTPTLKWQRGGCYNSWCETGWYSSPALVDVNGDGRLDIVASAYSVWALDGTTGAVIHSAASPDGGRTWPGVAVADIDKDGTPEIITANGKGYVTVYKLDLTVKWQRRPTSDELRSLLVADLDGNGSTFEIVVSAANGNQLNTWVYDSAGNLRPGWPQLTTSGSCGTGSISCAAGVYNANAAAANLDTTDSALELILPSDVHYIMGYKPNGAQVAGNSTVYPGKTYWGVVGVWENLAVEQRGWGDCYNAAAPRSEHNRPNFAGSPATIADLNGDGQREVVVAGNVHDCSTSPYTDKYIGPFIFNKDRTRFNSGGFNWTSTPLDTGAPLSEDYNVIENAQPNPVVADLDGDGKMEILYPSYDGKLHAFWLDKTEHGAWPFSVYSAAEGTYRFASEPVVADLDNDGKAEVIFTTWPQTGSGKTGKLYILNYLGQVQRAVDLPAGFSAAYNGALPAPTLGNVDADPDLEIVINSINSGVLVYDLPATSAARILWGTGRGSYQRDGAR